MIPFYWQWWRLALSNTRGGWIDFDGGERWVHVAFGLFWRSRDGRGR